MNGFNNEKYFRGNNTLYQTTQPEVKFAKLLPALEVLELMATKGITPIVGVAITEGDNTINLKISADALITIIVNNSPNVTYTILTLE